MNQEREDQILLENWETSYKEHVKAGERLKERLGDEWQWIQHNTLEPSPDSLARRVAEIAFALAHSRARQSAMLKLTEDEQRILFRPPWT